MFRQVLAISLSCVVLLAANPEERTRKLTEKVSSIPEGTIVQVKTIDNQLLKGRIGELTGTGFSVQTVRNEKVETIGVEYARAKSVKVIARAGEHRRGGAGTAGWVVVGGLAAIGTIAVITLAVYLGGS